MAAQGAVAGALAARDKIDRRWGDGDGGAPVDLETIHQCGELAQRHSSERMHTPN